MYGMRVTFFIAVAALIIVNVSARAVNISNTWMLPEEGFPVFYRYFRDRISWNEADAVCQFHHANLVTVDTTSQYDAIRAYLKELDIASNVWIGLSRSGEKPNFTWRDFRDLSSSDYWQEAIPTGNDPLCAAMDPAADFRWHALTCGGPEVASFICELPVPSWATGPNGCLITELPSLTVLFIPEQSAVELTSDCGLGGTKRIVCKGNTDRDEMMRRLACTDDMLEDKTQSPAQPTTANHESTYANTNAASTNIVNIMNAAATTASATSITTTVTGFSEPTVASSSSNNNIGGVDTKTTKPWIWTSNTIDTGDYNSLPTRHRRETEEDTLVPLSTKTTTEISTAGTTPKSFSTTEKPAAASENPTNLKESQSHDTSTTADKKIAMLTEATNEADVINTEIASTTTMEAKPESEEFASAINQGQLFSIIENGTMFDIIELNGTDENKTLAPDVKLTSSVTETLRTSKHDEFTTVIYHKEPTDRVDTMVTNHKSSTAKLEPPALESFTKEEVPEYPIIGTAPNSNLIKLNRTFRKKVPGEEGNGFQKPDANIDMDVDNDIKIVTDMPSVTAMLSEVSTQQRPATEKILKNNESAGQPNDDAKDFKGMNDKVVEVVEKVEKIVKDVVKRTEKPDEHKPYHLVEIRLHDSASNVTKSTLFVTTKRAGDKNVDNKPKLISTSTGTAAAAAAAGEKRKTFKTSDNAGAKSKDLKSTSTNISDKTATNKTPSSATTTTTTTSTTTTMPTSSVIVPKVQTDKHKLTEEDGRKDRQIEEELDVQNLKQVEHDVKQVETFEVREQMETQQQQSQVGEEHEIEDEVVKEASNVRQVGETTVKSTDGTAFDSEPTLKPNRQRQLTRSNRRSFYPYFFSRVLG